MEKEEEAMEKVEAIGSKQRQRKRQNTMGQNRKKTRINSHLITHFPTSSGVSEVSERVSAAERATKASGAEKANE